MPTISRCIFVSIPFLLTIGTLIGLALTWSGNVSENNIAQTFWFFGIDTSIAQYATAPGANTTTLSEVADWYTVGPWNYCAGDATSKAPRFCSAPTFGYFFNPITELELELDMKVQIPQKDLNALNSLQYLSKWSSITYLIALICATLTLPISILAFKRRLGSLLAAVFSAATAFFAIAASASATVLYATLLAVVKEGFGSEFNIKAVINRNALGATWFAALAAIIAFFFWLFTACCCRGRIGGKETPRPSDKRSQYQRVGGYEGSAETRYHSGYGKQEHGSKATFEPYRHSEA